MKEHSQHHDAYFHKVMADPRLCQAFLQHHLPLKYLNYIDISNVIYVKKSHVDRKLAQSCSDLILRVGVRDRPYYLYILIEHQSSVDRLMSFRIHEYMVSIMRRYGAQHNNHFLPLVVPLVLYHGKNAFAWSMDIRALIQAPAEWLSKPFSWPAKLIDLSVVGDDILMERGRLGLMEYLMKHSRDQDFSKHVDRVWYFLERYAQEDWREFLNDSIAYIQSIAKMDGSNRVDEFFVGLAKKAQRSNKMNLEKMMEITWWADGWREGELSGFEKGEKKGIEQGKVANNRSCAIRMLSENIDLSTIQRVTGISLDQLKKMLKKSEKIKVH